MEEDLDFGDSESPQFSSFLRIGRRTAHSLEGPGNLPAVLCGRVALRHISLFPPTPVGELLKLYFEAWSLLVDPPVGPGICG